MVAQSGQRRNNSLASLPSLGKGKLEIFGACPAWATVNWIFLLLAQLGQARTEFISALPKLGKLELNFFGVCPDWAEGIIRLMLLFAF
ncbi:MAG: hypothetical protein PHV20_01670 [Bacteroidales bacterium]|nr:hypothetical protein [Bacteroidales bacterium]